MTLTSSCTASGLDSPGTDRRRRAARAAVPGWLGAMTLADEVLPLIRTRADIHRWSASNAHGAKMHGAIDILESAWSDESPQTIYSVTHKALSSAVKVIMRADDSSGIIGDACRRLVALHPQAAALASVPPERLVDWMMKFQFSQDCDYFELDPVAYAPALGHDGLASYRRRLDDVRRGLGPRPSGLWSGHEWFVLDWNAARLAVHDRDIEAIIETHAKDRRVAAWVQDTAEAFEEIGEVDLAIDWARQATDFDSGHQSQRASDYWCRLLQDHRPEDVLDARLTVFRRWPSSTTATRLHEAAGDDWPTHRHEVMTTLSSSPRDAILFAVNTLKEVHLAWDLAHTLALEDFGVWSILLKQYEGVDPAATIPIHQRLVEAELVEADARNYRAAARRLATMRRLAAGDTSEVDQLIARLREDHRRRPRLQQEFDRAHLP